MKRRRTFVFIISLLMLLACTPQQPVTSQDISEPGSLVHDVEGNVIEITEAGYTPNPLTVKQGDTITWVNKDTEAHWIASAQHPTHTLYPGSDIKKCGSGETIFDACKRLAQGESFTFTFNEIGEWNYHDHLNPGPPFYGKIIVE